MEIKLQSAEKYCDECDECINFEMCCNCGNFTEMCYELLCFELYRKCWDKHGKK